MPTANPVPSYDPTDLLFNAEKLDEVVNGTSATYTDRRGVQRRTLAGLETEFPNAQANAAAAAASATAAAESATQAANEAASAATAVDLAFAEATAAQAARTGAEAARDAAQLNAGIYDTTALGLAATTNGQFFSVPGATSTVLTLYKNNAGVAQPINSYPASNVARLGRVTFSDNQTTYLFSDTAGTDVLIGWTTLRFLKGDGSYRSIADRVQSALIAGNALYIDVATDSPSYTAQEADISTIAVDVVMGTKILLAYNYYDGYMMGELVPMLMNAKQAAATSAAQTTANTAIAQAKLGRVMFTVRATSFLFDDIAGTSVSVGWTTLRLLKGDTVVAQVADRALTELPENQALYIDVAAGGTGPFTAQQATYNGIAADVVAGNKILLVANYNNGYLLGELAQCFVNKEMQAATAAAQTTASGAQTAANAAQSTANTAQTNALAARRIIAGEITSLTFSGGNAIVDISVGSVYKEGNGGAVEKKIAPLTGVTLSIDTGIVVDLEGGAVDASGRLIPTVVAIASWLQTGWQSGSKYVLAVYTGVVVHGLYKHSFQNALLAARKLIAGRVTKADWSGASVTVSISEGRAYRESNAGLPEKVIAPLTDQVLALDECLVVDLANGSVDASGRVIPVKLLVAQSAAAGWQTASKYILAANGGSGVLAGEYEQYIPAAAPASGYSANEVVVIQRADEVDIYMKGSNPASARYLRYRMQRKPSPTINSDVWRWHEVWEVERTGDYAFTTLLQICNPGENEMAIRQLDKSDFMGGTAHGDEELFTVTMLIDGVTIPLGGTGNYRARRVEFLQGSDMYEVDTVPAKYNRVAKSYKRWVYEGGEVELFNHIVWEDSITLSQTFMTMLTLMRWNGDVQISDKAYRSPLYLEEDVSDTYKINLTGGGSGFVNGETVTITANDGSGAGMEGTATVASGAITAIKVTKNGSSYTIGEAVNIASKSGAGTGAAGTLATGFSMVYTTAGIAKASGPTGYSAEVELLEGWDKPGRFFGFSNAVAYNKFYFDFTGPNYVTQVGEVFKSRTRYKLDTKN